MRAASCAFAAALILLLVPHHAKADVLVSYPGESRCISRSIKVGVWYQSYSGGARRYTLKIVDPRGTLVLRKSGRASTTWRYWRYRPQQLGMHKVIYSGSGWHAPYEVRVRNC